jgi:hypothetical protein
MSTKDSCSFFYTYHISADILKSVANGPSSAQQSMPNQASPGIFRSHLHNYLTKTLTTTTVELGKCTLTIPLRSSDTF